MSPNTGYFDGFPDQITIVIKHEGVFINPDDPSNDLILVRESIKWRRPNPPQDPGGLEFQLKEPGGSHLFLNESEVRAWHEPLAGGAYKRIFKGNVTSKNLSQEGANTLVTDFTCVGRGRRFKKPPNQLTSPWTIGSIQWLATHSFELGDRVQPYPPNGRQYEALNSGISGAEQPDFPPGTHETVEDGEGASSITWQEAGPANVTDKQALQALIPEYFGNSVDTSFINILAADVGYLEFPPGTDFEAAVQEIAGRVGSNSLYFDYTDFQENTPYLPNDFVEPTVPMGHWYMVDHIVGDGVSGDEPTWPTGSGAMVQSGNVFFVEAGLITRWVPNMPYRAGQLIEIPVLGRLFKAQNDGVSGAAEPTWPTTTGATVTTVGGTPITFINIGATTVLPVYAMTFGNDNEAHDASWLDRFHWDDANSDVMIPVLSVMLSDQLEPDVNKIPMISFTLSRESGESANAVFVIGANNARAFVPNEGQINTEDGEIRSIVIRNDALLTNDECYAFGRQRLGAYGQRETGKARIYDVPDAALSFLRSYRKVGAEFSLFGLAPTTFPIASLSGDMASGGTSYHDLDLGSRLLDVDDDIAQQQQTGREFEGDTTPPRAVRWITDPDDPNYYIVDDYAIPNTGLGGGQGRWLSGGEGDLERFYCQIRVEGESVNRPMPDVVWPDQTLDFYNIPQGKNVWLYVVGKDSRGNTRRKPDGSLDFSISPPIYIPFYVRPLAPDIIEGSSDQDTPLLGHATITVDKPEVEPGQIPPDYSGGGLVYPIDQAGGFEIAGADIPPHSEFPATVTIPNLKMGHTYDFYALCKDRYGELSPESDPFPLTITGVSVLPPVIGLIANVYDRKKRQARITVDIVTHSATPGVVREYLVVKETVNSITDEDEIESTTIREVDFTMNSGNRAVFYVALGAALVINGFAVRAAGAPSVPGNTLAFTAATAVAPPRPTDVVLGPVSGFESAHLPVTWVAPDDDDEEGIGGFISGYLVSGTPSTSSDTVSTLVGADKLSTVLTGLPFDTESAIEVRTVDVWGNKSDPATWGTDEDPEPVKTTPHLLGPNLVINGGMEKETPDTPGQVYLFSYTENSRPEQVFRSNTQAYQGNYSLCITTLDIGVDIEAEAAHQWMDRPIVPGGTDRYTLSGRLWDASADPNTLEIYRGVQDEDTGLPIWYLIDEIELEGGDVGPWQYFEYTDIDPGTTYLRHIGLKFKIADASFSGPESTVYIDDVSFRQQLVTRLTPSSDGTIRGDQFAPKLDTETSMTLTGRAIDKPAMDVYPSDGADPDQAVFRAAGFIESTDGGYRFPDGSEQDTASFGTVTSVTGAFPISSSGGTTPLISIAPATSGTEGSMSAPDKAMLDAATDSATNSAIVKRDASGRAKFADPSAAQDAATKAYVDAVAQGMYWKPAVRVASTANVTVSNPGTSTFDGVTLTSGDRVLLKNQSTASENGIYQFNGSSSAMTRTTDADASSEVKSGMSVWVSEGTANADSAFTLTTDGTITLGSTSLAFIQFSGLGQVTSGAGLTKTGNTLNVGAGTGITVNTDDVAVDTSVIATKTYADTKVASVGAGTATTIGGTSTNPTVNVQASSGSQPGTMSAADFTKLAGITAGASVKGSGTTNKVAYWSASDTITADTDWTYDASTNTQSFSGTTAQMKTLGSGGVSDFKIKVIGDQYGDLEMSLQNRAGLNGPKFSTAGSSVDLIDFVFEYPGGSSNIRFENRSGSLFVDGSTGHEMQLGPPTDPNLAVNTAGTLVRRGFLKVLNSLIVGTKAFFGGTGTTPTAIVHIGAGSAGGNSAPLKLTSGTNLTTPEAGAIENDGQALYFTPVAERRSLETASDVIVSSTTVANTTSETTLFTKTFAANELKVGKIVRLHIRGRYSTNGTSNTCTIRSKFGGTTMVAAATASAAVTNVAFSIDLDITIRSTGSGGTFWWYDSRMLNNVPADTDNSPSAVAVNTTTTQPIQITAQWNTANANNTISVDQAWLEYVN